MGEEFKPEEREEARVVKRSFWSKFKRAVLPEDRDSMSEFLWKDIIKPWLLNGLWDGVYMTMDRVRYKDNVVPYNRQNRSQSSGYTNYSKKSTGSQLRATRDGYAWDFDILEFPNVQFATQVRDELRAECMEYKRVSVARYYELAGRTCPSYTYNNYGWNNLDSARVRACGPAWVIELPRAIPLD